MDRITVYRAGMEPDALAIIAAELDRRGVTGERIAAHTAARADAIADGSVARRCDFCLKPAVQRGWGWHRLFGKIPLFPRLRSFCADHRPR